MRDIITDRLNKIEDLEQRKMLKNIMQGIFTNLMDYEENMFKSLEERIFSEIENKEKKYDIYITICHKNKVDPVEEFLHSIFEEDIEDKKYDTKEILQKLENREKVKLFTIFMNCSYITIKGLTDNERSYEGKLITDKGIYKIEIKLEQNKKYMKKIEKLYDIFQRNSLSWRTINNPYANKFFDVTLIKCQGITEEEEIKEISLNLEEYEKYKNIDIVPLWNIEELNLKSSGFPVPAIDKVNFEHILSLKKLGVCNGYLVDTEEEVRYIKRTEEELTIVSPKEKAGSWKVLKIVQPQLEQIRKGEYKLASNSRIDEFINRFSQKQASIIRTRGEINRIVNSFEVSKDFELAAIEIEDKKEAELTYDMNYFIADDIRVGNNKKIMKLKFTTYLKDSPIIYDLISFLVSEIQLYFPEYKCEGELI
ncbi:normocyte-binding protein [Clostridium thailandense]|uniref:normocyte-binding protein n=1 Tax=Clostridium thailandense TaxID=2794346 RepID=UPI003989BC2C